MSSFADRLVSRSAGTPPPSGVALLRPRPMSRFEPVTAAAEPAGDLETEAGAPFLAPNRKANDPQSLSLGKTQVNGDPATVGAERGSLNQTSDLEAVRPNERNAEEDGREVPDMAVPAPAAIPMLPLDGNAHMQDPSHFSQSDARMDIGRAATEAADPVSAAPSESTSEPAKAALPNRAAPSAPMRFPPAALDRAERQTPPPPTISIGRIDVQFLPQENRAPPPRAEPKRTRGFDAYARARLGEPR